MIIIDTNTDYLDTVYVNDFNDNYHRDENDPSSELEKDVRRIRRRYKNMSEYMSAVSAYEEYMEYMIVKYGGEELFKIRLRHNMIDDFIPPCPRMKVSGVYKDALKYGILMSTYRPRKFDMEKVSAYIEENYEDVASGDYDGDIEIVKVKKDKEIEQLKELSKKKLTNKKLKNINDISYLEKYFIDEDKKSKGKEDTKSKLPSLTQLATNDTSWMEDEKDDDSVMFYSGSFLSRKSMEEVKVFNELGDLGWDSLKLMKNKNVSKKVTKIVKEKTKKEKKKGKNKKKKGKGDDFISYMMDDDYSSFEDFEKDMFDFSSGNIFK